MGLWDDRRVSMILLDMDGVLCDFMGGWCKAAGKPEDTIVTDYNCAAQFGMNQKQFWEMTNVENFWLNLKEFPWTQDPIKLCFEYDDEVIISSSPSNRPECFSQKAQWVKEHTSFCPSQDMMLGRRKHLLARPGTALIDDHTTNIDAFNVAGGCGILFPTTYNCSEAIDMSPECKLTSVRNNLEYYGYRQKSKIKE